MIFQSDRSFRIWDYHVSHNRMLIRSASNDDQKTNIDIHFFGVESLAIPTMFHGLSIELATTEEAALVSGLASPRSRTIKIFKITSEGHASFLNAVAFRVLENELDMMDSSLEAAGSLVRREDVGRVLVHS